MSDSYRKAIIKDRPRNGKHRDQMRRKVRRTMNQSDWMDDEKPIKLSKEIVDDYDYSDYRFNYEHNTDEKYKKYCRK